MPEPDHKPKKSRLQTSRSTYVNVGPETRCWPHGHKALHHTPWCTSGVPFTWGTKLHRAPSPQTVQHSNSVYIQITECLWVLGVQVFIFSFSTFIILNEEPLIICLQTKMAIWHLIFFWYEWNQKQHLCSDWFTFQSLFCGMIIRSFSSQGYLCLSSALLLSSSIDLG